MSKERLATNTACGRFHNTSTQRRILILGVGNTLLKDEGAGVRVVEYLRERYEFPESVSCIDGGTAGPALTSLLSAFDHAIIVDAVRYGSAPGTLYRIPADQLSISPPVMATAHQIGIRDVLALVMLENDEHCPETVIIGVEPQEVSPGLELTPEIGALIPQLARLVMEELGRFGIQSGENSNA